MRALRREDRVQLASVRGESARPSGLIQDYLYALAAGTVCSTESQPDGSRDQDPWASGDPPGSDETSG
jgi:hypothetical protein